ncbi:MAG: hypothetical protein ABH828_04615 [archaeon]
MNRVKPNNESLDVYVNALERGIMLVNDHKDAYKGHGVVIDMGQKLEISYLRMLEYNFAMINTDSIEDCLADVVAQGKTPKIDVDIAMARNLSIDVEEALKQLYEGNKAVRQLRITLDYYITGFETEGTYSFEPSDPTLAQVVFRQANCEISDRAHRVRQKENRQRYKKEERKKAWTKFYDRTPLSKKFRIRMKYNHILRTRGPYRARDYASSQIMLRVEDEYNQKFLS